MGHSEVDQWRELGDGGTYHNVPSSLQKSRQANLYESSHKLYQNHTKNTKEQSEINHSNNKNQNMVMDMMQITIIGMVIIFIQMITIRIMSNISQISIYVIPT
jgi:hypothetical protein